MSKRSFIPAVFIPAALAWIAVGCQTTTPPARVPVPRSPDEGGAVRTYPRLRPLPPADPMSQLPPPAFDDEPLVSQAPPEQPAFLAAYDHIGRPRIVVFVNRTVEGKIIPVDERHNIIGRERIRVDGDSRRTERTEVYLSPGEYDDVQAQAIDYEALELALTDALAANGRVILTSPTMARQRLTDDEVKDLQSGRPVALREVVEKLDADILIQVQARPTKQTAAGLEVRVLVEAIDTHSGESIARSFVDVPPPLAKTTLNRYTRFLARRTMYELTGAWDAMQRDPGPQPTTRP